MEVKGEMLSGRQNGLDLILDGYKYNKKKENKNKSVNWRCRYKGCQAIVTTDDEGILLRRGKEHNHEANKGMTEAHLIKSSMKKRAREELTAIPQIYEQERKKILSASEASSLYRERAKKVPQTPQSAASFQVDGEWRETLTGEDFLLIDDVQDDSRILVFATSDNMKRLCNSDTVSMDGTFKICPKIFYQLYIVHSHTATESFPELFCLLPDKKNSTYYRLLSLIISKAHSLGLSFRQTTLIIDFELSVHIVVRSLLQSTTLRGCLFHFGQALWRKVQDVGLSTAYKDDSSGVCHWFKMFVGLAFLPVPQVTLGYDLVLSFTPNLPQCCTFNTYFRDTWISGHFPISVWNHFRHDTPRTNNNCEGYNSRLSKRALKPHLNVFQLILLFKEEHANLSSYILQLEGGHQPTKRRRITHVNTQLYKLGLEFMTCERYMASYLFTCGSMFSNH